MGHATVHYRDAPVTLCKNTAPDHECMPGRSECLQAMVRRHLETTRAIAATVAPAATAAATAAPTATTAPSGRQQATTFRTEVVRMRTGPQLNRDEGSRVKQQAPANATSVARSNSTTGAPRPAATTTSTGQQHDGHRRMAPLAEGHGTWWDEGPDNQQREGKWRDTTDARGETRDLSSAVKAPAATKEHKRPPGGQTGNRPGAPPEGSEKIRSQHSNWTSALQRRSTKSRRPRAARVGGKGA